MIGEGEGRRATRAAGSVLGALILERMRDWIGSWFPAPRLRPGATGGARRPVSRVIVFGRFPNPTFAYYLEARLSADGMPPATLVDIRSGDLSQVVPEGSFVLICRYATPRVLRWLKRHDAALAGVGLFLDDDIPAVVVQAETPWIYRAFVLWLGVVPWFGLSRHLDIVWASTDVLADRLHACRARVLPPAPGERYFRPLEPPPVERGRSRIVFYSQRVHIAEHRFLRPIMEIVLGQRPDVEFVVIADKQARRVWAGLPVKLLDPMGWEEFFQLTLRQTADIALVPLTPNRPNDARSATKRIDVARLGAAGLYSLSPAYGLTCDGTAEWLLGDEPQIWATAIMTLLDSPAACADAAASTVAAVEAMSAAASRGIPELWLQAARSTTKPPDRQADDGR